MSNNLLIDSLFFSLSDSHRREILKRICQGDKSQSEIGQGLPISKQAISKHLKVLEDSGLISRRKVGRESICSAKVKEFRHMYDVMKEMEIFWNARLDELDAFLNDSN